MNKKITLVILFVILIGITVFLILSKFNWTQKNNFQSIQTRGNNGLTAADAGKVTDIARSYLQKSNQQIFLYIRKEDGTISRDTGLPVSPTDQSIKDLKIDWEWFLNHEPDLILDLWQPPYPPGSTDYQPVNRYVIQWAYGEYTVMVKVDKNFNAQSTEIAPKNR